MEQPMAVWSIWEQNILQCNLVLLGVELGLTTLLSNIKDSSLRSRGILPTSVQLVCSGLPKTSDLRPDGRGKDPGERAARGHRRLPSSSEKLRMPKLLSEHPWAFWVLHFPLQIN